MTDLFHAETTATPILTSEGRRALAARADRLREVTLPQLLALRSDPDDHDASVDDAHQRATHELSRLSALLVHARTLESTPDDPCVVEVGEAVTIALDDGRVERYLLVDASEATVGSMRVTTGSPLGQAVLGRQIGDQVEVRAPGGSYRCQVLSAERPDPTADAAEISER